MKIKWETISLFKICIINMFFLLGCVMGSYIPYFKVCVYVIFIGMYYYYLIKIKDEAEIVVYQTIMIIIATFFLDTTFHYLKVQTPLELLYVPEGISLILLLKIFLKRKKYSNLLSDPFLKIIIVIIGASIVHELIVFNNIIDIFNAIRIYFRFVPIYIILSKMRVDFKVNYKILYIVNIVLFFLETVIGIYRDFRTGIFGIVGSPCFQVFISVFTMYMLVRYYYKQISSIKFVSALILSIIVYGLAEDKAFLLLILIIIGIVSIIINTKLIKKIVTAIALVSLLFIGLNIVAQVNPTFRYLLQYDQLAHNVTHYIFGNSNKVYYKMGRVEAMIYVADREHDDLFSKMTGCGLGASIPQEMYFYIATSKVNQIVDDFPKSQLYQKYGTNLGYQLSSFSSILIDGGYFGVVVSLLILALWGYKGVYLIRKGENSYEIFIGSMGICIAISSIFSCGYGGALTNRLYMLMIMIMLGMVQNYYSEVKARIKELEENREITKIKRLKIFAR